MSLPAWVYDLITAVEVYEDVHGPHRESWPCLGKVLDGVPEQERFAARAIVAWRQESGWLPPDAQLPSVPPTAAMNADLRAVFEHFLSAYAEDSDDTVIEAVGTRVLTVGNLRDLVVTLQDDAPRPEES